ncbi:MAG: flagellar export protein FliJ [Candidatus Scalindua sediminis]|nr:flagellar export protein FliJ [Candidatus Scalindua sediminis]
MPKYYFKLQPLLDKEQIYEDECVRGLRVIQGALQDEENKLGKLKNHEIKSQKELKKKKQCHITTAELKVYEAYFERLDNDIKNSKRLLKEITKKMEAVQNELLKIMKKRKALEKLKEIGKEEYINNLNLSLNKEMDDIAMTRFNNKQRA